MDCIYDRRKIDEQCNLYLILFLKCQLDEVLF